MKRVLIIGRRSAGEKNDARLLAEAIAAQGGVEVVGAYYEDAVIVVKDSTAQAIICHDGQKEDVAAFQTVVMINWSHHRLYTDMAHSVATIADHSGVTVWNRELVTARSSTKVSQLVRLSYEDVVIAPTVFSLTPSLAKEYIGSLGTPFVAKDPLASRGRNNHLCEDWNDFTRQADADAWYLFQKFISNDASDVRVFVAGGEAALAIVRSGAEGSHLNNVSQGATARLIGLDTLPGPLLRAAAMIARHFERELCGIDFMKNTATGEYVFLEINTTPQIVNGVFVEEKAAAMARALMR